MEDTLFPASKTARPAPNDGRPAMCGRVVVQHPAAREALYLYDGVSGQPVRSEWASSSESFRKYLSGVYRALGVPVRFRDFPPPPREQLVPGPVWVAFSSGKDSLATAIHLQEEGKKVQLYHLAGINRSWPDERLWAEGAAVALGLPLIVDEVVASGAKRGNIIEAPARNQIITLLMAARMLAHGGQECALGTQACAVATTRNVLIDWTDGVETTNDFDSYLAERFGGYRRHQILENGIHSMAIVAGAGMLDYAHSCIMPLRFRGVHRENVERKYGPLLPGRCGTCVKCCAENVLLADLGTRPITTAYRVYCEDRMDAYMTKTNRAGESYISPSARPGIPELRRAPGDWPPARTAKPPKGIHNPPLRPGYTVGPIWAFSDKSAS